MKGWSGSRALRILLAALAGFLAVGCSFGAGAPGPGPQDTIEPSPTPEVPTNPAPNPTLTPPIQALTEGWTEYQQPADGFAVALPASWRKVDAGQGMLTSRYPGLAMLVREGRQVDPDIRFLALDLAPESVRSTFTTNLNVLRRPLPESMTLADFGPGNVRELEKAAEVIKPVRQEQVRLPAGQALRLHYQMMAKADDGRELALSLTQLLLVNRRSGYVVTFATLPEQQAAYEPVFEEIGRTLRWLQE